MLAWILLSLPVMREEDIILGSFKDGREGGLVSYGSELFSAAWPHGLQSQERMFLLQEKGSP